LFCTIRGFADYLRCCVFDGCIALCYKSSAMKKIADCHLYGILDLGYVSRETTCGVAVKMIQGGIDVLQLRAKKLVETDIVSLAKELAALTATAGVPLVVNDYPHLVAPAGAQGAHVGQDDLAVAGARTLAASNPQPSTLNPRPPLIGKSTHTLAQAVAAEREGADYIGFGPIFATPTKPDYAPIGTDDIRRVHELVQIPIFCIGGIKLENLTSVLAAGATRVVIVSGILQAADVAGYTRAAKAMLLENANRKSKT
jgi:thiamine-phosphate pyrophosphorylase